jgi:formylmethanofuran dehydrogenase subunit E
MAMLNSSKIQTLLQRSASRHQKLCPKQVLGVRMGLYAGELLNLPLPNHDSRLLVILETDGCFADGIEVTVGCTVGGRTMRIEDYGKVAATFVDTKTEYGLRLVPAPNVRDRASMYADQALDSYLAQLEGYQIMPVEEMFNYQEVVLKRSVAEIISQPGLRHQREGNYHKGWCALSGM